MYIPTLLFVLYDSISNSVFQGQVLQPLIKRKKEQPSQQVILVSFERNPIPQDTILQIRKHGIECIVLKKYPFWGILALYPAAYQLKSILQKCFASDCFEIIARGPHAGWICINSLQKNTLCKQIVIQARGLLSEEFSYTFMHQKKRNKLSTLIHTIRKNTLCHLEYIVYSQYQKNIPLYFEAVSPALKAYLSKYYKISPDIISIAQCDIPPKININQKTQWRNQMRTMLGIPNTSTIYCYNGSIKSWQCPEAVVSFFIKKYQKNKNAFLLILTQDKRAFEELLDNAEISKSNSLVCTVKHSEIFQYLAVADFGIILRENHLINWVSRPTKALEYQAVQIPIIHNNTVAYLIKNSLSF